MSFKLQIPLYRGVKQCENLLAINEQIQNIAQKKDTLCRMMYN